MANTLRSRGVLLANQGEFDKALKLLREAYPLYLELYNLNGQADSLRLQHLYLLLTDRAGEAEKLRPQLEALLPKLPPPDQKRVRETLAYVPSKPEA